MIRRSKYAKYKFLADLVGVPLIPWSFQCKICLRTSSTSTFSTFWIQARKYCWPVSVWIAENKTRTTLLILKLGLSLAIMLTCKWSISLQTSFKKFLKNSRSYRKYLMVVQRIIEINYITVSYHKILWSWNTTKRYILLKPIFRIKLTLTSACLVPWFSWRFVKFINHLIYLVWISPKEPLLQYFVQCFFLFSLVFHDLWCPQAASSVGN